MERERWDALCARLGAEALRDRFDTLVAAYGEDHRHYHTAEHIGECLALFDEVRSDARRPDAVEYALWVHDVVYSTRRSDNEDRSADVGCSWLADAGAASEDVEAVRAFVLATRHESPVSDPDGRLVVDIDLNVLGASPERFDRYDADVRKEYWWVPGPLYRRKRAEVLKAFLRETPLYQHPLIRERLERQARDNLARAVARLR